MRRARLLLVASVGASLAAGLPAPAHASAVGHRIGARLAHSPFRHGGGAIAVYDQTARRMLYAHRASAPMLPASNMKLPLSIALLGTLGERHRFHTRLATVGRVRHGVLHGSLWLVGGGDPSLATMRYAGAAFHGLPGRLPVLVRQLRRAGVRRIRGAVLGDDTRFDARRTGRAWTAAAWGDCSPISALLVNEDLPRPGYAPFPGEPALHAARMLRRVLVRSGIAVDGGAGRGHAPRRTRTLAQVGSPPLAALVHEMNLTSNNLFAEVLLKDLGSRRGLGTSARGAAVVRRYLASVGVPLSGFRMADGSGLSRDDRMTARGLALLLARADGRPYRATLRASLPRAGETGTLEHRLLLPSTRGRVVAKTGTLIDASTLSGYARTRNGHRVTFSILLNRSPFDLTAAWALEDRIVAAIATSAPTGAAAPRATAAPPADPQPRARRWPHLNWPR
jgi:serine-type D-Ala-D-Ala carboxypeptidase/endopeptidase (penicillin-binding protein 4)